jgi:hypothetical protein
VLLAAGVLASCTLAQAGHDDVKVDPALRRNPGKVTALSPHKPLSFEAKPLRAAKYAPDELRGWRVTVLSGKRFGAAFDIESNTESEISVASSGDSLEGLAVGDLFIAEGK